MSSLRLARPVQCRQDTFGCRHVEATRSRRGASAAHDVHTVHSNRRRWESTLALLHLGGNARLDEASPQQLPRRVRVWAPGHVEKLDLHGSIFPPSDPSSFPGGPKLEL